MLPAIVCALAACAPTALSAPGWQPENRLGGHLLLDDGRGAWPVEQWEAHIAAAADALGPGGIAVQLVQIDDLDTDKWQRFMDLCAEYDLTPVLRLATDFDDEAGWWIAPPRGPGSSYRRTARQYADFVAGLEWPGETHPVIVGNEPNRGDEWGGIPDPAAYTRFLIDTAEALHRADPAAVVINGPLDLYAPHTNGQPFLDGVAYMDAESFLAGMLTAGPDVFEHVDVWGSHAYPLNFAAPPWEQSSGFDRLNGAPVPASGQPPPGIRNRGINAYQWELWWLDQQGIAPKPVLISETGWRHAESLDPDSTDSCCDLPDAARAAVYLDLALGGNGGRYPDLPAGGWTPWLADERVVGVVLFALDGNPAEWGHTNLFRVDAQGAIQGTYPALEILRNQR